MKAPMHPAETARMEALREYRVLDSERESSFDDLTLLASQLCHAPVALMSFIDAHRQWFKSERGLGCSELPRDSAFCAHAILEPEIMVVEDARSDERFVENPLVTGPPHIRFYAGAPLITPEGLPLGTLCVIDSRPRALEASEAAALGALARTAMRQLELRREARDLADALKRERREGRREAAHEGAVAAAGFRKVFSDGPVGMALLDRSLTIVNANRQLKDLIGRAGSRLDGVPFADLVHPDDRDADSRNLAGVLEERIACYDVETRLVREGGGVAWVNLTATLMLDPARKPLYVLLVIEDITVRKEAEETLARLNATLKERVADLEAANADLEAFGYSVSHDLRTPLRAIEALSRAVEEDSAGALDATSRLELAAIKREAERSLGIVDGLLALSRAGRGGIERERVDVSALARDAIRELEAADPARRVTVVIEDGLEDVGDAQLVRQVIANLLSNAWKFTRHRADARIEVGRARDDAGGFFVRDNGAGFDPARADEIFQPFRRLHAAREFEGSGVGLATVKRIVERHGGRVWAEGVPGEGATFRFMLDRPGATPRAA